MSNIRKRFAAVVVAAALALTMPVAAFAANSSNTKDYEGDDWTAKVENAPSDLGRIEVTPGDRSDDAIKARLDAAFGAADYQAYFSWDITAYDADGNVITLDETTTVTLSLEVGSKYDDYLTNWFVQHDRSADATESGKTAIADGSLNVSIKGTSELDAGITTTKASSTSPTGSTSDDNSATTGSTSSTSTSSKSPKTGVDNGVTAGIAVAALAIAGGALVLRRKLAE